MGRQLRWKEIAAIVEGWEIKTDQDGVEHWGVVRDVQEGEKGASFKCKWIAQKSNMPQSSLDMFPDAWIHVKNDEIVFQPIDDGFGRIVWQGLRYGICTISPPIEK